MNMLTKDNALTNDKDMPIGQNGGGHATIRQTVMENGMRATQLTQNTGNNKGRQQGTVNLFRDMGTYGTIGDDLDLSRLINEEKNEMVD